jgi:hypothetical protein
MTSKSSVATGPSAALDVSPLVGTWVNTNSATGGISKIVLTKSGSELLLRVLGACVPEPCDWGEVRANFFADTPGSSEASSFTASYDFDFMSLRLFTYVVKGVLVVITFNVFHDDSGRSNYFGKEFFFRA